VCHRNLEMSGFVQFRNVRFGVIMELSLEGAAGAKRSERRQPPPPCGRSSQGSPGSRAVGSLGRGVSAVSPCEAFDPSRLVGTPPPARGTVCSLFPKTVCLVPTAPRARDRLTLRANRPPRRGRLGLGKAKQGLPTRNYTRYG